MFYNKDLDSWLMLKYTIFKIKIGNVFIRSLMRIIDTNINSYK